MHAQRMSSVRLLQLVARPEDPGCSLALERP